MKISTKILGFIRHVVDVNFEVTIKLFLVEGVLRFNVWSTLRCKDSFLLIWFRRQVRAWKMKLTKHPFSTPF